jgi:hypothetical protein
LPPEASQPGSALASGLQFLRQNKWLVLCLSALLMVPCLWHRHIEAGDLGSHVYNAWLAQLISKDQAPGLYIVNQWNNVLFDLALLHTANWVGFAAAEKVVVSGCVLVFFWGVFALAAAVSGRAPWFLTPCIGMLAYGYSFSMGFMNYYVSIGLACFCLALVWRSGSRDWLAAAVIAVLTVVAHPLGFVWLVATIVYVTIRRHAAGAWRFVPPVVAVALLVGLRFYIQSRTNLLADWRDVSELHRLIGTDQLIVYGERYVFVARAVLVLGVLCCVVEFVARRKDPASWRRFDLPTELYFLALVVTWTLPENLRVSLYSAWIGLLVSRLTLVSAILALCVIGLVKQHKWHLVCFTAAAAVFFSFLYQDTATLNRMEANAVALVSTLPPGTRVVAMITAERDWRAEFVVHIADRACIGHCFLYSNYEPASRQFRIRAHKGSPVATDSSDDSEDMQAGAYEVQDTDPALKQLYQCDLADRTKLCLRDLKEGDNTGEVGIKPGH